MTPEQIDRVTDSFAEVLRRRQDAGMVFYQRLFAIAPELRPLFKSDLDVQARKLVDTLAAAIGSLHDTPALSAELRTMGERHRAYGVRRYDYLLVGEALIATLELALGGLDPDTREAWVALYREVSMAMIAGAGYVERASFA